jgi:hypothetical protein
MGSYYSVMLETFYESYYAATAATTATDATTDATAATDAAVKPPFTTPEMFANLGTHPGLIKKLKSIKRDKINVPIDDMGEFIDDIVEFIDSYIDLSKMGGKYSKLWKGYVHHAAKDVRFAEIKKYIIKILAVDDSSDKADKSVDVYLKKIITHFTGDECGGFKLVDTREGDGLSSTINYMHQHKQENMLDYINKQLNGKSGFVFCTEHDWDSCLEDGTDYIMFHRFNPEVHKDNAAKGLYYSPELTVTEFDTATMRTHMTGKPYFEHFDTYLDKYVVFSIKNQYAKEAELFHDEVIVIGLHCKSMGSKSDIEDNMMEYRFLKSVIDTFKGLNRMVIGDFNLPEFTEGADYFGLGAEERLRYPIQDTFNSVFKNTDTYLTQGLKRWSNYAEDTVAEKERIGHVGINSQSVGGKCFVRGYNTDFMYGDLNIEVTTDSRLFPHAPKVPQITGNSIGSVEDESAFDWLSDHQVPEVIVEDTHHNIYNISAYNVLSKCCSGGQPFKDVLTCDLIDATREEMCDIMSELTNIIVENLEE